MSAIKLNNIKKAYGKTEILHGIDLDINDGEFCVFVGPSGCGKSTLLRVIAGLESITSGDLYIDDKRVNHMTPPERGIAMVFQSYALYPHMTVYKNMAFGLKMGKAGKDDIDQRVRKAAKSLQLEHLLDRRPSQLSGGQRQRVAIWACHRARATGVFVRRAIVQSGCGLAGANPAGNRQLASGIAIHRDLRDSRSG